LKAREQPTYRYASWLFIRLLGLCFIFAFASLALEVSGLIGEDGIWPLAQSTASWTKEWGAAAFLHHPTIFLFDSSEFFLWFVVMLGFVLAAMIVFGVATQFCLLIEAILYLSLVTVGGPFFHFQWDLLLLECAVLALFIKPWQTLEPPFSSDLKAPSGLVVLLFDFLLFRVMFASGVVKLLSGDVGWRSFSTMNYYYETQLLPGFFAWYAHQLPAWMQTASCISAFFIELVVPFLIFLPLVRARVIAFFLFLILQVGIQLTGNHGWFNFLTVVISLFLLPDSCFKHIPRCFYRFGWPRASANFSATFWPDNRWLVVPLLSLALLACVRLSERLELAYLVPHPLKQVARAIKPFCLVNGYGLYNRVFATRTEISLEGSDDLVTWQPYLFKYKIGELNQPPPVVSPLAPRLDWRMRFAALVSQRHCPWFHNFVGRLLAGARPVTGLLKSYPQTAPRYIRAHIFEYQFTSASQRERTGNFWQSSYLGPYLYPVEHD